MQSSEQATTAAATINDCSRYILQVYVGALSLHYEALSVEASKQTTAEEIVSCIVERLGLPGTNYELAEVVGECKERRLTPNEKPVSVMLLWPKHSEKDLHRFYLRESHNDAPWIDNYALDPQLLRDCVPFLFQPENREYPDLCQLPDLNESTLLENLRQRFDAGHIYTYVGSILIAVNPFKFHPIYNPKYVRLYQNQRIRPILPPHIFAIADNAYYSMLKEKRNQCIVISGESGSGKTESTNFLLHHLTALSQKGCHGSGVEQTILSAGPVLEAFGNAKTAHNNNSSRFGKFIQVNYRENGLVQGAVVQKYLLEKSRIVSQGPFERNYHVFYYLLSGTSEAEREALHLLPSDKYAYLNAKNLTLENCDESYEFSRLKQSMEMVGFSPEKQRRLFNVLSAVLLLGNVEFFPKKSTYHHDESVQVRNPDTVQVISELLKVKQDTLMLALTTKRAKASGETLIMQYKLPEAIAARDALAKCLYGALFDWIVLQVNHALLNKDQSVSPHTGQSIGVLDIFGFEDFGSQNAFEQFCINYANEHLQYYFNLHVFKYEQTEYRKECIKWRDIEFMDNSGCLHLFETKPMGLLCILDDLCNFPGATNETLLQKFNSCHKENPFYEKPQKKEFAFIIKHYAGKVKYQVSEMREKNMDLMRQDIVSVLKNSSMAFVRELVGADPVAVFRWAILRAFFRGYFAFRTAGVKHRKDRADQALSKVVAKARFRPQNELLIRGGRSSGNIYSTIEQAVGEPLVPSSKSPRRTWSSIAMNNKNFPDGKQLGFSGHVVETGQRAATAGTGPEERAGSGPLNNSSPNSHSSNGGGRKLCFDNRFSKFERSGQDVMARASQIVQKNKSFRPRERAKKGLKNLQTVKTLIAGQNLSQTSVKARKQPLTVTAQFQNSLGALMDTLNQANPYFIRCIKSNQNKIANKFDEPTVTRQLRYTGMLETVRIRRAGYNVRLSYEEFIQLYRILLPKGLVSSQKDVRDFMNTMDLNKQHYQLGLTKIYMRESQKTKLDMKLHKKIIDSIIMIQRWFRGILQRRKFVLFRSAAVTLQSFWRMCAAQKRFLLLRQERAAVVIQSAWKMVVARRWFLKLRMGVVFVQSHIRGKLARARFKKCYKQKLNRDRAKLKQTQSLPVNERSIDCPPELREMAVVRKAPKPHASLDMDPKVAGLLSASALNRSTESMQRFSPPLITPQLPTEYSSRSRQSHHQQQQPTNNIYSGAAVQQRGEYYQQHQHHDYNPDLRAIESQMEEQLGKGYDVVKANKIYTDEASLPSTRQSTSKAPVRRVDSGPGRRDLYYESRINPPAPVISSRAVSAMPLADVEVVLVNSQEAKGSAENLVSRRDLSGRGSSSNNNNSSTESINKHQSLNASPYHGISYAGGIGTNLSSSQVSMAPGSPYNRTHRATLATAEDHTAVYPTTPKGKAAALLGTISESKTGASRGAAPESTEYYKLSRRVKSNFSDELPDTTSHSHHHNLNLLSRRTVLSSSESLKRRNSDPSTNKVSLLDVNRGNDMYQSSTHINIAGHRFRKAGRIGKADKCASCQESDAFVNEGHRCLDCKVLVHTKCIQNGGVKTLQCEAKRSKRRKNQWNEKVVTPNSKYSGTREYTDSTDKIISDAKELQLMQDFITQKICKMESDFGKPSEVDRVFKQALREFKDNLVAQYSIANKQNTEVLNIKYRDLIANFEQVMETCCGDKKDDFPLTMGVNAFRGFMNEFMNSRETEKPKTKRKKDKKRKIDEHTSFNGHIFQLTIINIPTACEICQLFLLWPIERGLVCQNCRLTCHRKCYLKAIACSKISGSSSNLSPHTPTVESRLFGCTLAQLCAADGGVKIPIQIEQLITKIEMHGLYSEGLYRKSGVTSKIKELKAKMCDNPNPVELDFESYNVHVLTNVLKSFLREMPEPLLTFDRYDDFLRAADLSDVSDRVQTLLSLVKKIPATHHALLERLVFHLALVAQREQYNRMSAGSLAIVFAPCVLRTNRIVPAQDSLNDIGRQTKCIETLITQKMLNVKSTLADIDTLDTAAHTATTRLSTLRSSKIFSPEELASRQANIDSEAEETLLEGHIQEIKKEKALLTSTLPSLARASSDDDLLSTDLDGEGGSLDDLSIGRGAGDRDTYSMSDSKDFKDSVESALCHMSDLNDSSQAGGGGGGYHHHHQMVGGDMDASAAAAVVGDSAVGVSYNIRDKNIGYIHGTRSHQISLERGEPVSSPNRPQLSMSGASSSTDSGYSKYVSGGGGHNLSRESRQKPVVMRSVSTGYEQMGPAMTTTATITIAHPSLMTTTDGGGGVGQAAAGGGKNANNSGIQLENQNSSSNKHRSNNNNNRKPKRQSSLDDEPIMV